jgi:hypothetical protein
MSMPAPQPYLPGDSGDATPSASSLRDITVDSGVGTATVLLLTGGGIVAGMAGSLGGSRLRRRHSLA